MLNESGSAHCFSVLLWFLVLLGFIILGFHGREEENLLDIVAVGQEHGHSEH